MGATTSRLWPFVRSEARGLLRYAWRGFWPTAVVLALLGAVLTVTSSSSQATEPVSTRILVGLGVGLYYGVFVGAVAAAFAALWRLFGPSLLVVLVIAPVLALVVVWLFHAPIASSAVGFLDTVIASARQVGLPHTAEAADGMKLSCGGGGVAVLFLIILAPFLIADAATILTQPDVLWAFLHFGLWMALAIGMAILTAVVFALPVLLFALIRRGRRRFAALEPSA